MTRHTGQPGRTILLNGPPAAGKTSLARALQEIMDEPYFRWGVDTFFATVPSRWAGGPRGELRHQGIYYKGDMGEGGGRRVTGIGFGPVGRRMLMGMHRAFHAFAVAGNDQIIDGLLWDKRLLVDFLELFVDLDVVVAGIVCSPAVLAGRELERGGPYGLSDGVGEKVHDGYKYDVIVDTSDKTPSESAQAVADWLASAEQPHALKRMFAELVEPC